MLKRSISFKSLVAVAFSILIAIAGFVPAMAFEQDAVACTSPQLLSTLTGDGEKNAWNQCSMLGGVAADASAAVAGTDVAIINGGDLGLNLQPGEQTWGDLMASFPENRELAVVEITASDLFDLLEHGVSYAVLDEHYKIDREKSSYAGFPQISGCTIIYDMSAPVGERIYRLKLSDGRELERTDTETKLTVCASEYMLTGGFDYPVVGEAELIGETQVEALAEYLGDGDVEVEDCLSRVKVIGCSDYTLLSDSPWILGTIVVVLLAAYASRIIKKELKFERKR